MQEGTSQEKDSRWMLKGLQVNEAERKKKIEFHNECSIGLEVNETRRSKRKR